MNLDEIKTYVNGNDAPPATFDALLGQVDALAELLEQYGTQRDRWIAERGDDEGFDTWFTAQVIQLPWEVWYDPIWDRWFIVDPTSARGTGNAYAPPDPRARDGIAYTCATLWKTIEGKWVVFEDRYTEFKHIIIQKVFIGKTALRDKYPQADGRLTQRVAPFVRNVPSQIVSTP